MDPSGHCGKDPNGDFMPPAVVPEGKQLPAVYVPQQEALRRWCANFQDDAGTAGRAGTGGNGDFMPPAVIPKQPLPSLDPKRPSLVPEPPRQLPAVIYPQPQDLLDGNPQNRVSGPVADVPNSGNRVSGGESAETPIAKPNSGQGFSSKGYNPQPGERTFDGYVNNNVPRNMETKLFTNSSDFNTNTTNDGHFKRFGTEPNQHGIAGPHVHQPIRNINPNNGVITGKPGSKTKNGGVTVPGTRDIKQLYEYLENGKYH